VKPSDIYALPSLSSTPWYRDFSEVLPEVLNVEQDFGDPTYAKLDTKSLLVHTKLGHTSDGSRAVTVYALTFEDKPFAVMFTAGRGGQDKRDYFVTDTAVWKEARNYVQSVVSEALALGVQKAQVDVELISDLYDATFVETETGYRAVNRKHAHPVTRALVYDQKKFAHAWREAKQSFPAAEWNDPQKETSEIKQAVLEAYLAGVVGTPVPLNTKLSEDQHLFAASVVDGFTFAYVFEPKSRYAGRGLNTTPWAVGPASMLECYREIAEGRTLDPDLSYIRDLVKTFGVSQDDAIKATTDFITEGGKGVAERLMAVLPRDQRVPEEMEKDYGSIALAYRVIENHAVMRLCPTTSVTWAASLVDKADTLSTMIRLSAPPRV
jgi:hypothetical protein